MLFVLLLKLNGNQVSPWLPLSDSLARQTIESGCDPSPQPRLLGMSYMRLAYIYTGTYIHIDIYSAWHALELVSLCQLLVNPHIQNISHTPRKPHAADAMQ